MYDTKTRRLRHNQTNPDGPYFLLRGLRGFHPMELQLYAANRRGKSKRVVITGVTVNRPEKHTDTG